MSEIRGTARITGIAYLGLAITALVGYQLAGNVFIAGDPAQTTANLVANEDLLRASAIANVLAAVTQALAAIWFWQLFRPVQPVAAGSVASFGIVNSTMILLSTAGSVAALQTALDGGAGAAAQVQVLVNLHSALLTMSSVFFGMWLVPMGWLAHRCGYLPRQLGWVLMGGGIGYLLSTMVALLPGRISSLDYAFTVPATVGEVWMVGYLLVKGTSQTWRGPV